MIEQKIEIVHEGRGGYVIYDGYKYIIDHSEAGHFCIHFPSGNKHGKLKAHLNALDAFAKRQNPKWSIERGKTLLIDEDCTLAQTIAKNKKEQDPQNSVLHMALSGLIEIEEGLFNNAEITEAARHISNCQACTDWLDELYPESAAMRKRASQYCCSGMASSVTDPESAIKFKFTLFRQEEPCWSINDTMVFARYCPWCGTALPKDEFEDDPRPRVPVFD